MVFVIEIHEIRTNKIIAYYPTFGQLPLLSLPSLAFHNAMGRNRITLNAYQSDYRFVLKERYSPPSVSYV
jgi:hypothetical protein